MLKIIKIILVPTILFISAMLLSMTITFADSSSDENSSAVSSNMNVNGGSTIGVPSTVIKNWHEIK